MTKDTIIPIGDLRYVQIECSNEQCKTALTLDLKLDLSVPQQFGAGPKFTIPIQCPTCKLEFKLGDSITNLIKAHGTLLSNHTKVSFLVKQEAT